MFLNLRSSLLSWRPSKWGFAEEMSYSRPHPQASKQFPGFGAIVLGVTIIPSIVVYNTMNTNTIIITTVINIDSNDINFILDDDFLLNLYMNFKYCIFNKTNLVKIMIKCLPFLERDHLSKCTLKMFFTRISGRK